MWYQDHNKLKETDLVLGYFDPAKFGWLLYPFNEYEHNLDLGMDAINFINQNRNKYEYRQYKVMQKQELDKLIKVKYPLNTLTEEYEEPIESRAQYFGCIHLPQTHHVRESKSSG